ncbi:acyltransferase family protein [Nakamurella sp. PAMC28650]|uniref:acyltransferase family protein n=1 Tax=Nakamurella sp. PAMC28650 TaxID=2762325 RepID=UPI00164D14D7|nr:acyltransferase family protein [Nakamurella sp. PAMC28650]QNK80974.1 acyltransferase [Nakamurella sp. PAMC28650]
MRPFPADRPSSSRGFRPDIEGLRAVAVIFVILEHLFGWPKGGFVGVDIFFVISGFLITGLLLKEQARTGRVSFLDFYRRRIRRIIPASTLVLGITVVGSYFVFQQSRFHSIGGDSLWSLVFLANWHFASIGTDYFTQAGPTSPLQHYWSLAVEEQFYLVWPLLIAVVLAAGWFIGKRSRTTRIVILGVVLVLIIAGSFTWALYQTRTNTTVAYFSTLTRAWELGFGALLAVMTPQFARMPGWLRPALSWVGLAGIVVSVAVLSTADFFPAPGAALPVAAAGLVIVAGVDRPVRFIWPITNVVARYLGRISYSLYLWHFPVIILFAALIPGRTTRYFVVVLAVLLVVSVLAFHLIEDPIRSSSWLMPSAARDAVPSGRRAPVARGMLGALLIVTACGVVLTTIYYAKPLSKAQAADIAAAAEPTSAGTGPVDAREPKAGQVLTAQIAAALTATSWPTLNPSLDSVLSSDSTARDINACSGPKPPGLDKCTWGNAGAKKTVVVMGDSVSVAYLTALRDIVTTKGSPWRLISYSMFGCTFVDIPIHNSDSALQNACPARKASAIQGVATLKPDLVIITNTYEPRTNADTSAIVTLAQWRDGMTSFAAKMTPSAKKVMLLAPPPSDVNIATCYTKASSPKDCVSTLTDQWSRLAAVEKDVAANINGVFVDSSSWFCSRQGQCPSFVGGIPVKRDLVHMTSAYADKIAPVMLADLQSDGYFLS